MAQNLELEVKRKTFARVDYSALRFKLNKIPTAQIMSKLYSEDELELKGISDVYALDEHLSELRDLLAERARVKNPHIASLLADARRLEVWPKAVVDYILKIDLSEQAEAARLDDSIGLWFKPVLAKLLRSEGFTTLRELKNHIEKLGSCWYKPIPRLGAKKAMVIERWFDAAASTLGGLKRHSLLEPDAREALRATPIPLERINAISSALSGAQGSNRCKGYCLITARHDVDAIRAYLLKFQSQEKTLKAYKKEVERFFLWSVLELQKAMSSLTKDDCLMYMQFLRKPGDKWVGPVVSKKATNWKPFKGPLSDASVLQACRVASAMCAWLTDVRYLQINPWKQIALAPMQSARHIKVDGAMPAELWQNLVGATGYMARLGGMPSPKARFSHPASPEAAQAQIRVARAAVMLMGSTGMLLEEVAALRGNQVTTITESQLVEIKVTGGRAKDRTIYADAQTINAIDSHLWDRGLSVAELGINDYILAPLFKPATSANYQKSQGSLEECVGFSSNNLYRVIKRALTQVANSKILELSEQDRQVLLATTPSSLRHTFGTQAANAMAPAELQEWLGHASVQSSLIYAKKAKGSSTLEAAKRFFKK